MSTREKRPEAVRNICVLVYMMSNNTHPFMVETMEHGREYAKRIITEGFWIKETMSDDLELEVFYPPHQVFKVKVWDTSQ